MRGLVLATACFGLLAACGPGIRQTGPAWSEPEPEYESHYAPLTGPVELEAVEPPQPGQGGDVLPQWTACEKDSDCVALETECCGFVAVHRDHWNDARAVLPYSACDMLCPSNVQVACASGECQVLL